MFFFFSLRLVQMSLHNQSNNNNNNRVDPKSLLIVQVLKPLMRKFAHIFMLTCYRFQKKASSHTHSRRYSFEDIGHSVQAHEQLAQYIKGDLDGYVAPKVDESNKGNSDSSNMGTTILVAGVVIAGAIAAALFM